MPELRALTVARNPLAFPPPEICDYDPNLDEMEIWLDQLKEYMRNKASTYDGNESGVATRFIPIPLHPTLTTVTKKRSQGQQSIHQELLVEVTAWIQIRQCFQHLRVPNHLILHSHPHHRHNLLHH
jgi:hypothetical protein